jgi:phosphocarrier protein HPr
MSVEKQVTIKCKAGLHARPATLVANAAARFQSTIELVTPQRTASAKSLIGIMSLGLKQGSQVILRATGPDAAEAVAALVQLLETNLDEPGTH